MPLRNTYCRCCRGAVKVVHILHNNTPDFYRVASINGNRVSAWWLLLRLWWDTSMNILVTNMQAGCCRYHMLWMMRRQGKYYGEDRLPQLTFVGVLYEHKGVKILPQVIKQLCGEGYKFHFTFIGEGIFAYRSLKRSWEMRWPEV